MTPIELLKAGAKRFAKSKWTRKSLAVDKQGFYVPPWQKDAVAFSPMGALMAAGYGKTEAEAEAEREARWALQHAAKPSAWCAEAFNEKCKTQHDALTLFTRAIKLLEKGR